MSAKVHSVLAPSSSSRWLHCNGSVAANAGGGRSSFYAEQGTAAHELLELCLRLDVEPVKFLGTPIYKDFIVTEEMAEAVALAMDWIGAYMAKWPSAKLHIEKRVDPHHLLKCAKDYAAGTLDVALDRQYKELIVMDYKHGAGVVVEIIDNTQLMMYLLGYVSQFAFQRYERYRMVIIQPRGRHHEGPVREVNVTYEELMEFAARVRGRLKSIAKNPDERTAGEWCKFCRVQGKCAAVAARNLEIAGAEFGSLEEDIDVVDPKDLTKEQRAFIILNAGNIEKWLKAVYADVREDMLRGQKYPELKLVKGRSTRFFGQETKVHNLLLKDGFDEDDFAPRKMVGVPGVEKLYAARRSEAGIRRKKDQPKIPPVLSKHIEWSKPEIHIAPAKDARDEVTRGAEFSAIEPTPANARARKAMDKKAKRK